MPNPAITKPVPIPTLIKLAAGSMLNLANIVTLKHQPHLNQLAIQTATGQFVNVSGITPADMQGLEGYCGMRICQPAPSKETAAQAKDRARAPQPQPPQTQQAPPPPADDEEEDDGQPLRMTAQPNSSGPKRPARGANLPAELREELAGEDAPPPKSPKPSKPAKLSDNYVPPIHNNKRSGTAAVVATLPVQTTGRRPQTTKTGKKAPATGAGKPAKPAKADQAPPPPE